MQNTSEEQVRGQVADRGIAIGEGVPTTPHDQTKAYEASGENSPKMVTISEKKLTALLERMERLEAAADKRQLARYDMAKGKIRGKTINLLMLNGKVIIRWSSMVKNLVEKDPITQRWHEDQVIKVQYEDNTVEEMPYVIFGRRYTYLPASVISETKEKDKLFFKVKTEDGKEYNIQDTFIN